jgi:hypothetical protein
VGCFSGGQAAALLRTVAIMGLQDNSATTNTSNSSRKTSGSDVLDGCTRHHLQLFLDGCRPALSAPGGATAAQLAEVR